MTLKQIYAEAIKEYFRPVTDFIAWIKRATK